MTISVLWPSLHEPGCRRRRKGEKKSSAEAGQTAGPQGQRTGTGNDVKDDQGWSSSEASAKGRRGRRRVMSSFYPTVEAAAGSGATLGQPGSGGGGGGGGGGAGGSALADVGVSTGRHPVSGDDSLSPGTASAANSTSTERGDSSGLSRRLSPGYGGVGPVHAPSTPLEEFGGFSVSPYLQGRHGASPATAGHLAGMGGGHTDYHRSVQQQQQQQHQHQQQQQQSQANVNHSGALGGHPHPHQTNNNYLYYHHHHHPHHGPSHHDTGLSPSSLLHEGLQGLSPTSGGATTPSSYVGPDMVVTQQPSTASSVGVNCCLSPHSVVSSSTSTLLESSRLHPAGQTPLAGVSMTPMFPWMAIVGRYHPIE